MRDTNRVACFYSLRDVILIDKCPVFLEILHNELVDWLHVVLRFNFAKYYIAYTSHRMMRENSEPSL